MVFRRKTPLLFAMVALAGCRNEQKERREVQNAILSRLQNSAGLDLKTVDVTTTDVNFKKNLAYATVAFHPKDDPNIANGMTMKYTLEERDGKWVVVNVADSQGHGLAGHGRSSGDGLPAGHPPVEGAAPQGSANPQR